MVEDIIDKKKVPELPHLRMEDLSEEAVEVYAGVLLLTDLIKGGHLSEDERIRCSNLRNHWLGLFCS